MIKNCSNCEHYNPFCSTRRCVECSNESNWTPKTIHDADRHILKVQQEIRDLAQYGVKFQTVPRIKDVIFNPPATIIIWEDKTKTVVKCGEKDIYDPEKGMAMAISRKALGDRGSYYNVFEKWLESYIEKCGEFRVANPVQSAIYETLSNMSAKTNKLREIINNMSGQVLSYADELKGEVTSSDISEDTAAIEKECINCKYRFRLSSKYPCANCFDSDDNITHSEWKPREGDELSPTEESDD